MKTIENIELLKRLQPYIENIKIKILKFFIKEKKGSNKYHNPIEYYYKIGFTCSICGKKEYRTYAKGSKQCIGCIPF